MGLKARIDRISVNAVLPLVEFSAWCPGLIAAMILSGPAVHTKGLRSWLVSAMKQLMAAWSSTMDRETPRLSRRVSLAEKGPTALSHEQEVGVKWKRTADVAPAKL